MLDFGRLDVNQELSWNLQTSGGKKILELDGFSSNNSFVEIDWQLVFKPAVTEYQSGSIL